MKKLRVYQLAKELNVEAKALLAFLQSRGSEASSTLSMVELHEEEMARQQYTKGGAPGKGMQFGGARLVGRVQRTPPEPPPAQPAVAPAPPAEAPVPASAKAPTAPLEPPAPVAMPQPSPSPERAAAAAYGAQVAVARPAAPVQKAVPAEKPQAEKGAADKPAVDKPAGAQGPAAEPAERSAPAVEKPALAPAPEAAAPKGVEAAARKVAEAPPEQAAAPSQAPQKAAPRAAVKPGTTPPASRPPTPHPPRQAPPAPGAQRGPKAPPPQGRQPAQAPASPRPHGGPGPKGHGGPRGGQGAGRGRFRDRGMQGRPGAGGHRPQAPAPVPVRPGVIELPQQIVVRDLASRLGVPASEIIKQMMKRNVLATITQEIPFDVAAPVAESFGFTVQRPKSAEERFLETKQSESAQPEDLQPRPPVVTIMGHVDHGKTTLLDVIRKTRVAAEEFGGITQHIGAYQVEAQQRRITFLDTPGHEAFTSMRARGAQVTDIAVLVVAADDGVMPQTVEAISHAKAAGVPIVVAINKIDKPTANPDRVKQQLSDHGLVPEDWGGDTVMVPVSALRKQGIDDLLEMILLVADLKELKAPFGGPASGIVVEAELDRGRGPVATVLVKEGTLRVGDPVIVGAVPGRVRALLDDRGRALQEATPAMPVVVLGLSDVPQPGDSMMVTPDEETARRISQERTERQRAEQLRPTARMTLENLSALAAQGETHQLNIVLKADVQGSLEALQSALQQLPSEPVQVSVIHAGVGGITEADVGLASASDAIIIGFNVRPDGNARRMAERDKVDIRTYRIIYEAIDDVKAAMQGMLKPRLEERVLGRAEVRRTFKVPGVGVVAGCYVTDGRVARNASVRVLRNQVVVYEGKMASLKRFKDDVREVAEGFECGIGIERFNDVKEGDVLEFFEMAEVKAAQPAVASADRGS